MNRRNFLLLGVGIIASSAAVQGKNKKETTVFGVDLHCDACVKKVMKNISFEKGVKDVKPNMEKKEVIVVFDNSKTNNQTLTAAFKKIGYDVKIKPSK